jgi:hypothetical protein
MKASDEVVLVHILQNRCHVSPDGATAITSYRALVLRQWKGHGSESTIWFSVPSGAIRFADGAVASTTGQEFRPLANGMRYVVFLRSSNQAERGLTRPSGGWPAVTACRAPSLCTMRGSIRRIASIRSTGSRSTAGPT